MPKWIASDSLALTAPWFVDFQASGIAILANIIDEAHLNEDGRTSAAISIALPEAGVEDDGEGAKGVRLIGVRRNLDSRIRENDRNAVISANSGLEREANRGRVKYS